MIFFNTRRLSATEAASLVVVNGLSRVVLKDP